MSASRSIVIVVPSPFTDDTETLPEADITKMTRRTTAATFQFPPMRDGTPHVPAAG